MGLDMYLTAKKYLWNDKDKELSEKIGNEIGVKGNPELRFQGSSLVVKGIEIDAMYWRKANQIHNWFVENVQDGEDNCEEHHVEREQLIELMEACKQALETKDSDILEPIEGFFFGSTEIDEYYWDDLKLTVEGLQNALTLSENEYEFYYRSSW